MHTPFSWLVPVLLGLLLAGCSSMDEILPDQTIAYKKQREASQNLEVPPDLSKGEFDDALDVPTSGTASYSEYTGERTKRQQTAGSGEVLPEVRNVDLRREGNTRWLEVSAPRRRCGRGW